MAKLQLGKAPTSFKRTVSFEYLDGSKASIELDFKYRTRSQYAELMDAIIELEEGKDGKKSKTFADMLKKGSDATADLILQMVNGWDLEDEFNRENIAIMIDSFPQATAEISEAYRLAILEGRIKN